MKSDGLNKMLWFYTQNVCGRKLSSDREDICLAVQLFKMNEKAFLNERKLWQNRLFGRNVS